MLHVLEKIPRSNTLGMLVVNDNSGLGYPTCPSRLVEPQPQAFGVGPLVSSTDYVAANEKVSEHDQVQMVHSPEELLELKQLRRAIAARKMELKEAGTSLRNQRQDAQVAACTSRMKALHSRTPQVVEKIRQRCRNRCHVSVQLPGAVDHLLALGPDKLYVDCTFGRGGHTALILSKLSSLGRVKAFDIDPLAVQVGRVLENDDCRFQIFYAPFGDFQVHVQDSVAGVLLDLGVSSPQLDDASRGFSVKNKKDGLLDLRMNQEVGIPASDWLDSVTAAELAWVITRTCYRLESPVPERVAETILQHRPYKRASELANILHEFNKQICVEHPNLNLAHIVFCAIRVFLNREEEQLARVLEMIFEKLEFYGRCVIICFTRWEIALVRQFVRDHEEPTDRAASKVNCERLGQLYPLLQSRKSYAVQRVVRPIAPDSAEIAKNQRAKSSMQVLQKVPRRSDVPSPFTPVLEPQVVSRNGGDAARARFVQPVAPN